MASTPVILNDERQIAVRGSAYKTGFMVTVLCNLSIGILMSMLDTDIFRKYAMSLFIGTAFRIILVALVLKTLQERRENV